MFKEVLPDFSYNLMLDIFKNEAFNKFYLAGGTSLALQIGHRESIDLDFFTDIEFKSNIVNSLGKKYEVIGLNDNAVELIVDNTKVFFFFFAFPLVHDLRIIGGGRFARPVDIGLMKLLALQGRTTRKDIIDLYFIDQEIIPLEELLEMFETHYPKESFNSYSSLKKLFNFETLEAQPMPKMYRDFDWDEARDLVVRKVSKHIQKLIT